MVLVQTTEIRIVGYVTSGSVRGAKLTMRHLPSHNALSRYFSTHALRRPDLKTWTVHTHGTQYVKQEGAGYRLALGLDDVKETSSPDHPDYSNHLSTCLTWNTL
jgi:hypothetical protein